MPVADRRDLRVSWSVKGYRSPSVSLKAVKMRSGPTQQGFSVGLSAAGTIAIVGGWSGNVCGGAWIFAEPPPRDLGGKGRGAYNLAPGK